MSISNLEKYRTDLDRLVEEGGELQISLNYSAHGHDSFYKNLIARPNFNEELAKRLIDSIKPFTTSYQHWYSEAVPLVKQLLPDRLDDFVRFYEKPKNRKNIDFESYRIEDACQGLCTSYGGSVIADSKAAVTLLMQQVAIVEAIKRRFNSSLFDIKQLVQADLFDSELESARELLKNNYVRAAGAIAGVVLEGHLKQVCDNHNIPKKTGTISVLNDALKAANIIELSQYRHIQLLGDLRNKCGHKNSLDPSTGDIEELINGTNKLIKTIF